MLRVLVPLVFVLCLVSGLSHARADLGLSAGSLSLPSMPHPQTADALHHAQAYTRRARTRRAESAVALAPPVVGTQWSAQGATPIFSSASGGLSMGITYPGPPMGSNPASGAIERVLPHPTDPSVIYVGTTNGGIFKTENAFNAEGVAPTWRPLTDHMPSLSTGALVFDEDDATFQTLWVGTGSRSSYRMTGTPPVGVFRSTDGGDTWNTVAGNAQIEGNKIRNIVAAGSKVFVVLDNNPDIGGPLWRSDDTGDTFTVVPEVTGTGFDIMSNPNNRSIIALSTSDAVWKSVDGGDTWTKASESSPEISFLLGVSGLTRMKLSWGRHGNVFASVCMNGTLLSGGLFWSADEGDSWTQLDVPTVTQGNGIPRGPNTGGQCAWHHSLEADPNNPTVVYVGGDSQYFWNNTVAWPNALGAQAYVGKLFKVDGSQPSGSQGTPLVNCADPGSFPECRGTLSTFNNSAPHADSRAMAFSPNGQLIEGDDGGLYFRSNPTGSGDWFSLHGPGLQNGEFLHIAYDSSNEKVALEGAQDNGSSQQLKQNDTVWEMVLGGDGGDVAVELDGPKSYRYMSAQFLGNLIRFDFENDTFQSFAFIQPFCSPQFYTPLTASRFGNMRVAAACADGIYESVDRGLSWTKVYASEEAGKPSDKEQSLKYGVEGQPDVLFFALAGRAPGTIGIRRPTDVNATLFDGPPSASNSSIQGVELNLDDWTTGYAITLDGEVFQVTGLDTAAPQWTDITGDLSTANTPALTLHTIEARRDPGVLFVGTNVGVFTMVLSEPGTWRQYGTGLPNVWVYDMFWDQPDDLMVIGTLGRGAWSISAGGPFYEPTPIPTATPSDAPTGVPSSSPTFNPTSTPTFNPTSTPTFTPSVAPTSTPTATPTASPPGTNTAVVIGLSVVGGVIGVALIVGAVFLVIRRRSAYDAL